MFLTVLSLYLIFSYEKISYEISFLNTGADLDVHACMHDFEAALIRLVGRWFKCKHHILATAKNEGYV